MTTNRTNQPGLRDMRPPRTLLTLGEAAAVVRAPEATLRYWRHIGVGPRSFKMGRRVMYDQGDLWAWIEAQRNNDDPHAA